MYPDWVESQLRKRGIRDERVLQTMASVPRHRFVPPEEQHRAYGDAPIGIGLGQTISQPYIVGFMSELLQVGPEHRVLEVGTGSGYQTAILAELAREVFTIEIHASLQEEARQRLEGLGYANVRFDVRNGYLGWPEAAPFDRIMVTAGAPAIPQALIDQMAADGRMVIPTGPSGGDQMLQLVAKSPPLEIDIRDIVPVRFVPLVSKPEA